MSMTRAGFLARLLVPVAAVGADVAKKLDPDGEPIRELDGQLVVNGDNVVIQNVNFRTGPSPTATAVRWNGKEGLMANTTVWADSQEPRP